MSQGLARLLAVQMPTARRAFVTAVRPSAEVREEPDHPGYELAYQEGLRGIVQQQAVLNGLHTRAGTLLAAASIVTVFLGDLALGDSRPTRLGWLAIGLFLAAAAAVVYVLKPRDQWHFRSSPTDIIRNYVEDDPPAPLWAIHKQLAEHLENDLVANYENMKPLFRAVRLANVFLAGEVLVWLVILAWR
jgi:hypothetical protein